MAVKLDQIITQAEEVIINLNAFFKNDLFKNLIFVFRIFLN